MAPGHNHHPRAPADAGGTGSPSRDRQRQVLVVVLAANATFLVVEAGGGFVFRSLALLADAAHMLSDVASLSVALVAQALMARPASRRHSFGLQRAEVLGAQINGILLVASAGWILYEAWQRLGADPEVAGVGLVTVASAGLAVNLISAVALARAAGTSLNMRGALIHMAADAAGSVAAVAAGVAIVVWDATWVDPAASMAIAVLVLWAAWRLLRAATHVLLEGTPEGLDPDDVADAIAGHEGISGVHHLHLWSLASDVPALSAHLVLEGQVNLHEAQARGDDVRQMLERRFGVAHATLELECHDCEVSEAHLPPGEVSGGPAPPRA